MAPVVKAVVFEEHGGPEVLHLVDVARPTPGPGEVLVRVRACALNHLDLWQRRGLPGVKIPLPHIPGSDIAGVVEEVGPGVDGWRAGDEVIVAPGFGDGVCDSCLEGRDNYCPNYRIIGYQLDGGYAEFVKVPARNLLPKPRHLSFIEAASMPLVFLTAWHMLVGRARVKMGESVLVISAGSGVGTASIQVAKLFNCTVITTVGSDDKVGRARGLGADHVINWRRQDVYEAVKELTGGRGVDIVVEHVGAAIWDRAIRCLARGGRLVTCGATTGPQVSIELRHLFSKQLSILGSYMGSLSELREVWMLVERGLLKPVVDSTFPLEKAPDAHRRLESQAHFGKVVLTVD